MILEIIMWGFFSYWGWQLGDYVKDKIKDKPETVEQVDTKEKKIKKDF